MDLTGKSFGLYRVLIGKEAITITPTTRDDSVLYRVLIGKEAITHGIGGGQSPVIIPRFDWKGSDNFWSSRIAFRRIIPRFDWKGSDNSFLIVIDDIAIIPRFDWKGSDNLETNSERAF